MASRLQLNPYYCYQTPPEVFDPLHAEFGFTLDVAASPELAKLPRFYTEADNGLMQNWIPEVWWCNPPNYGPREKACAPNCTKKRCAKRGFHIDEDYPGIEDWMAKAAHEGQYTPGAMLVPVATGTRWWRRYVKPWASELRFIEGRVKFLVNGERIGSPNFDSVVVIYDGGRRRSVPRHTSMRI